jgi:hypothetical protein
VKNDQHLSLSEFMVSVLEEYFGAMFSDNERKNSKCSVSVTESEGVSQLEQGYVILMKNNNQKVQGEGVHWSNIFASFINENDLEAGAEADLFEKKPVERVQIVLSILINFQLGGERLATSGCEGVLCKMKWYKCYSFNHI